MWLYSAITSLLPGGEPTPIPPPPSAENPSPFQYPVLDESSDGHNPTSFHDNRPSGTFLLGRTITQNPQYQSERDLAASIKIKGDMYQTAEPKNGPPPANGPKLPEAPRSVMQPETDGTLDHLETPALVDSSYLKANIMMLCSESSWQLRQCVLGPGMVNICQQERKRNERCKQHTRAFLQAAGFGRPDKTREQDALIMRESDIAFQELVQDGSSAWLPVDGDVASSRIPPMERF